MPKIPRSILTSRCVARVWNFASVRNPTVFTALWMCIHSVYSGYISLVLLHGSCSSILLALPFPYLVSKRPCMRVRARSYQLAHTSMFRGLEMDLLGVLLPSKSVWNGTLLVLNGREVSLIWRITRR